jgi:HEAT repeat protein
MIRSNFGLEALDALQNIDPDGHTDRLLAVALSQETGKYVRAEVIARLGRLKKPEVAKRLLPLLEDATDTGVTYNREPVRVCDNAATAIAELNGLEERIDPESPRKEKDAFIDKVRKLVGTPKDK